jgi:hypothetical protein
MSESHRRSREKHDRRNSLVTKDGRPRLFGATPHGRAVIQDILPSVAKFMNGELAQLPPRPPSDLGVVIYRAVKDGPLAEALRLWLISNGPAEDPNAAAHQVKPVILALAILSPLLDSIYRGMEGARPIQQKCA